MASLFSLCIFHIWVSEILGETFLPFVQFSQTLPFCAIKLNFESFEAMKSCSLGTVISAPYFLLYRVL